MTIKEIHQWNKNVFDEKLTTDLLPEQEIRRAERPAREPGGLGDETAAVDFVDGHGRSGLGCFGCVKNRDCDGSGRKRGWRGFLCSGWGNCGVMRIATEWKDTVRWSG